MDLLFHRSALLQEYGITSEEKRTIGSRICHHLLRKIMFDLSAVCTLMHCSQRACTLVAAHVCIPWLFSYSTNPRT